MKVSISHDGHATILDVEGVVKLGETAAEFSRWLEKVKVEDSGPLIIDFERISYMDSTGLGVLVGYVEKFDNQRRALALVRPSHRITALLELTKLNSVFRVFGSVEEAMRHVNA